MIVTLTTDFGDSGGFAAQIKAKLLQCFDSINIVDITHGITPFNTQEAAYIIATTAPHFPENSIHIVVVDPNVGTNRKIAAIRWNKQFIIAPDNASLSLINEPEEIVCIDKDKIDPRSSNTFEGRDIMAKAACFLNKYGIDAMGYTCTLHTKPLEPIVKSDRIIGNIVYIDRFGNCISNINILRIKTFKKATISDKVEINTVGKTYSDSKKPKALVNSAGFFEFTLFENNFAETFNIQYLDTVEFIL